MTQEWYLFSVHHDAICF